MGVSSHSIEKTPRGTEKRERNTKSYQLVSLVKSVNNQGQLNTSTHTFLNSSPFMVGEVLNQGKDFWINMQPCCFCSFHFCPPLRINRKETSREAEEGRNTDKHYFIYT